MSSSEQLKTVIVSPRLSYYTGGGERVPLQQAKCLLEQEESVEIITRRVAEADYSSLYVDFLAYNAGLQNPIPIHEVEIPDSITKYFTDDPEKDKTMWPTESLAFASAAATVIQGINPDNVMNYYLMDGLFRLHNGSNLIYLLGNPPFTLQNGTAMIRMYDAALSISREVQNYWGQYMAESDYARILHTGVELPAIPDIKDHQPTDTILFAGRLIERKGVDILLQSFKITRTQYPDSKLIIAGDGPERSHLESMVGDLEIADAVTFMGIVGPDELQRLYNYADLCVFPSKRGEGLMGVVLESMASAKPVITTTDNGNEDVITNHDNGLLVQPENVDELAASMSTLLGSREIAMQLGENARRYIEANLTWEKHAEKLHTIFQELKKPFAQGSF